MRFSLISQILTSWNISHWRFTLAFAELSGIIRHRESDSQPFQSSAIATKRRPHFCEVVYEGFPCVKQLYSSPRDELHRVASASFEGKLFIFFESNFLERSSRAALLLWPEGFNFASDDLGRKLPES